MKPDKRNFRKALMQNIFPHFRVFLQSYYGEPSIQQKILGLLVGSECVETSRLVSLLQLRGADVSGSFSTFCAFKFVFAE